MILRNKKNLIILFVLLLSSFSLKIFYLDKIFSEIDDRISTIQILRYQGESLYSISNDKLSPSYNSEIKKKIRKIEKKDNYFFNLIEKTSSKILMRAAPSKHSTYAPMQYIIFAGLISKDQNYNQLKFNSRLPSVIFSILYILLTYLFCSQILPKENKFSMSSVLILITSFPLLYISLRSYNYAAGTFTTTVIFFFTYLEIIGKNFSLIKLSSKKINLKKSIFLGFTFSLLSYLNYSVFFILPFFFIVCFFKHLKLKNLFSYININLFVIGISFIIFSLPIIIHIFNMNLHQYGVSGSTGGDFMEYHLSQEEKKDIIFTLFFFLKNFYLVVSRNLSFFTDNFILSKLFHLIIFLFVCLGTIVSRNENYNLKMFSNFSFFFIIYYFTLVYFEVITLGPTTHSNFYTPLFAILFIICLRFFYQSITKFSKKIFFNLFILFLISIFSFSSLEFYNKYSDVFNEDYMVHLIKKYNVSYISTISAYSDQLCLMKNINVLVRTCPFKYNRYNNIKNLDEINLKLIKQKNQSVMFVNDIVDYKLNHTKYEKLLINEKFKLIKKIDNTKFSYGNSPLYISEYEPNILKIYIYK